MSTGTCHVDSHQKHAVACLMSTWGMHLNMSSAVGDISCQQAHGPCCQQHMTCQNEWEIWHHVWHVRSVGRLLGVWYRLFLSGLQLLYHSYTITIDWNTGDHLVGTPNACDLPDFAAIEIFPETLQVLGLQEFLKDDHNRKTEIRRNPFCAWMWWSSHAVKNQHQFLQSGDYEELSRFGNR